MNESMTEVGIELLGQLKRKLASPDISSTRHGKCQKDPETRREKVKEEKQIHRKSKVCSKS